ncbi:PhoPQ-activated protein PqaA family protein [Streptomyces olivochromogenes]|uniref:PhoPQ-activated protein PqaA family protein n=1 Tax=Streptomyces olivochromogenes TaxID=1963 RepID=UPI0036DA7CAD
MTDSMIPAPASAGDDAWKHVGPAGLFDLGELYDTNSLDVVIEKDAVEESTARPGARVRKIALTFTSQQWHGMTWRHPVHVYAPAHTLEYPPAHGIAGIIGTEADFWNEPGNERRVIPETGQETEKEYAEGAAVDLGIPVMIFATPPELPTDMNESDLNGYSNRNFFETGDFTWYGYYPVATSYLRAITLLTTLPGLGVRKAVLFGHSKRGIGSSITTGVDPDRLAGIVTTGTNGMNMLEATARKIGQFGMDIAGPSVRREGLGFLSADTQLRMFNTPLGFEALKRFDPYFWRDSLTTPWLVVNGTNDPFFAVDVAQSMRHAKGPTTLVAVDNVTHTWASQKILAAWRMWLDHLANGRPLPTLENLTVDRSSDHLTVTTRTNTPNTAAHLATAGIRGTDWRQAKWSLTSMTQTADGTYRVSVPFPADTSMAWYVELRHGSPSDPGFVTSAVKVEAPGV